MKAANKLPFLIATFFYFATFAFAEDTYRFERMWPSFPHQWYFDDPRAITLLFIIFFNTPSACGGELLSKK
ncbi:hypothetical protein N9219_03585 [bacterium]|nr:hypothetical protein [bacterium]